MLVELCPALRVRSDSAAFYPVKQAAPWTVRHLLAKETGKFSPENLRDKMPRRAFYPAFQGSAFRLHCLTATRSAPFQSGLGSFCCTLQRRHSRTLPFRTNQAKKMDYPLANKIRTDFHLPCQKLKSHGWRLSNTEICLANLRSLQKSMEGFLKDHTPDWSGGRVACNPLPFPQGNGARRRGTTESG